MSETGIDPGHADALGALLAHARAAPYWRTKISIDGGPEEILAGLLPVTGEDLRRHGRPGPETMLTRTPDGCFVFASGGSRGTPKLTYREVDDFEYNGQYFDGLSIGPGDVVANLFSAGIWGTFTSHNIGLAERGCVIVPLGAAALTSNVLAETMQIMRAAGVNTLAGSPSTILLASRLLSADLRESIVKVYCIGELVTAGIEDAVKRRFPLSTLRSTYGTVDCTGIGVQCAALDGARYHPLPDVIIELSGPDGSRVADGEPGRITVTRLRQRVVPIIRYQPGDEGQWDEVGCPDHPDRPVLQVLGRADEKLVLGSAIVSLSSFHSAVSELLGAEVPHTVVVDQVDGVDLVSCEVELPEHQRVRAADYRALVYRREPELAGMVTARRCAEVSLKAVPPGSLRRSWTSGKVREVVDLRRRD